MKAVFLVFAAMMLSYVSSVKVNGFIVNPSNNETQFIQLSSSIEIGKNESKDDSVPQNLKNNSLFNEISGFQITGGLIGKLFSYVGTVVENISGLNDREND